MARDPNQQALRLRKKHAPGRHETPDAADGARLIAAQSAVNAVVAGLVAVVVFAVVWTMLTTITARVLPWFTLVLGGMVGLAVRRGGQGFDWRFPSIAAGLAFAGSILGNVVVAASITARGLDVGTFTVLKNATTWTWPVFFSEVMNAADFIYAAMSAGLAAFLSGRRLTRREYHALRLWQEQRHHE